MNFKKIVSVLMLGGMIVTTLAGCSKSEEVGNTASGESTQVKKENKEDTKQDEKSYVNPPGVFPIVDEQITLTVGTCTRSGVDDFENNDFTKWLEEKTNINLEFTTVIPEADYKQKLMLMMASGDYPDILIKSMFSPSEQQLYGAQGIIVPLNDLIEKHCVEIPKVFESHPLMQELSTMSDGNIYDIYQVNECFHCGMTQKMWVYEPWLEQLGLELPQTPDEFYNMLVAFRDNDLNGNGKKDELPLVGSPKGWDTNMQGFLMQPFSRTDTYVENGKIIQPFNTEGYREGLRYINKLYNEGLIYEESFTQDDSELQQLGSSPDAVIIGAVPGGFQGSFTNMAMEERWQSYTTIAPLEGPSGLKQTRYTPFGNYFSGMNITDKCKYPEAAIRLADALMETEATMRSVTGVKGHKWDVADEGSKGLNGEPATWKLLPITDEENKNKWWGQNGPAFRPSSLREGQQADENSALEIILYTETKEKYEPYAPSTDTLFPPLSYTEEQASEIATLNVPINTFREEMEVRFMRGELNLDKDWDNYVQQLEDMGLSRLIEIYQEAYDQKYNK